jgi:hypothetical protein
LAFHRSIYDTTFIWTLSGIAIALMAIRNFFGSDASPGNEVDISVSERIMHPVSREKCTQRLNTLLIFAK